jgi:hypothetical protein
MNEDYDRFEENQEEDSKILHPNIVGQVGLIGELLEKAREHNLDSEVVTWALKAMQEDPTLEPYEAFGCGYGEWIK